MSTPSSSRVYPILPIVHTLVYTYNVKVIIYSCINYKTQIEKVGAEFRPFFPYISSSNVNKTPKLNKCASKLPQFISELADIAQSNTLYLAREINTEDPDLLMFENTALHAFLVLRLLKENYALVNHNNQNSKFQLPQVIYFSTKFVYEKTVHPCTMNPPHDYPISELIKIAIEKEIVNMKVKGLCDTIGIKYLDPFEEAFNSDPNIVNMVLLLPELHPKVYLYHRNNKFIGTVINENINNDDFYKCDSTVKSILQDFFPQNDVFKRKNKKSLVFVYIQNSFFESLDICVKLIEALNDYCVDDLLVLFSFSQNGYASIQNSLRVNEFVLSSNICISTNVPKLDVLKRSDLFITNCDMMSVNQALFYGVPMMCIPISNSHLLVANRLTTELGLGKLLDFTKLEASGIQNNTHCLLNISSFKKNCSEFSRFYHEYDVRKNATDIIFDVLGRIYI